MINKVIKALRMRAYKRFMANNMQAVKTVAYYVRALRRAVLNFYRGEMDAFEFIDDMVGLIEGQFTRAWNEGAREAGTEPKDMTDEDKLILIDRMEQEQQFILGFASDIETARMEQTPITPLYNRVELWANRYNEVRNEAIIHFRKGKLEWKLGQTEEHCTTCAALNGIVALAEEWEQSGIRPQNAPNEILECGGWQCDCSLDPTDKRKTNNALNRLLDIAAGSQL